MKPILEFVSQKYAKGWLLLAELLEEDGPTRDLVGAREYVRRYLEHSKDADELSRVWKRLADLCAETGDWLGEIHALSALTTSGNVPIYVVCNVANRINGTLRRTETSLSLDELRMLLTDIIEQLEIRRDELSGNDCSRLSWLYLHLHDTEKAHEIAKFGLTLDQENPHCQRLVERLST